MALGFWKASAETFAKTCIILTNMAGGISFVSIPLSGVRDLTLNPIRTGLFESVQVLGGGGECFPPPLAQFDPDNLSQ